VSSSNTSRGSLPPGFIFEIARQAGLEVRVRNGKALIRCPVPDHEDRHKSAFVSERNVFYCSVCTPGGGWTAKQFATLIGVPWQGDGCAVPLPARSSRPKEQLPAFGAPEARHVWSLAQHRAMDEVHTKDAASCDFLRRRHLERAWRGGHLGFVGPDVELRHGAQSWFDLGVRLVVPLYAAGDEVSNVQGRNVFDREPRLLFPKGSRAAGSLFANPQGIEVLKRRPGVRPIILAEGLTDFLALATVPGVAVLSAPGAGMARHSIGPWVFGVDLVLGFDLDGAGAAAREIGARAAREQGARRVRTIRWPSGARDACEVLDRIGVEGLDLFVGQHLLGGSHV
jgi:hypothetical protein